MRTLHISILDKKATYLNRDGDIVCGNSDYVIEFAFDAEWATHEEKIARFIWNGHYDDVTFTGTSCPVPIITNATEVEVGVYAGELSTTTPAVIGCQKSILCKSAPQGGIPFTKGEKGDPGEGVSKPTASDNGKVLTAKDGEAVWENAPEELPVVELTTTIVNEAVFTAEESEALSAAVALGKPVIVNCVIMETPNMSVIMHNYANMGLVTIFAELNFMLAPVDESGLWVAIVTGIQQETLDDFSNRLSNVEELHNDLVTDFTAMRDSIPQATAEDNGKFLRVVDGAYALVALTDVSVEGA